MNMHSLLSQYFGYETFRPLQEEVISSFIENNDTLVLMPTGGGKSICFQIPALMKKGLVLVISPLIALMKDQVDSLNEMGISATFLNSTLSLKEQNIIMQDVQAGDYKLLYIAPERLGKKEFRNWLQTIDISGIAVDEAHCISQWGHDFRPDYRNLQIFKKEFPHIPIIALTASATPQVQKDIIKNLHLNNAKIFQSSFYRKNLALKIIPKRNMRLKIIENCKKNTDDSIIIYCFSRKETEEIAEMLCDEGIKARAYHAGLNNETRSGVQEAFLKDNIQVVTATIAFGMGVDKPNIRIVMHTNFPKTLEGYYQETGRAGRDGLDSECILLWSSGDARKHEFFMDKAENQEQANVERVKMKEVMSFCEQKKCRWHQIVSYFGETPNFKECGNCDICLASKETFNATEITQKIISTVVRTENKFGKNHVLKVLRGSKAANILRWGHQNLPVWGIEQQYSLQQLSDIFEHLVHKNILEKNSGEYATYRLSKKGLEWLKSKKEMLLPKIEQEEEYIVSKTNRAIGFDTQVFVGLRALRKTLADEKNIPPFIIFNDNSLQEMAYYLPQSVEGFGQISGVGEQKKIEFGEVFIEKIKELTNRYQLQPKPIPSNTPSFSSENSQKREKPKSIGKILRIKRTKEMLENECSIDEIVEEIGLSESTIYKYIIDIISSEKNNDLISHIFPSTKIIEEIKKAFTKHGTSLLKPVFEELEEKISYDDIKIVRVALQNEKKI